jgi:hypothetical protein
VLGEPEGKRCMKILVVADKVQEQVYSPGLKERMSDVELVLSCGDLPFYYLEFIVSSLNVPLLYVFGNHNTFEYARTDPEPEVPDIPGGRIRRLQTRSRFVKRAPEGCINVDERVVHHKGLLIAGLEGSMRYKPDSPYQYTDGQMCLKAARMSLRLTVARIRWGRPLDILITHAPAYGIHDGKDLPHRGFRSLLGLMRRFQPRYLIHGHRHIYHLQRPEVSDYQSTHVMNVYGHWVMEVDTHR